MVEPGHGKQGTEAQQLMFEVLQNLGSVAQQHEEVAPPPGGREGQRQRLAWEAAQRQDAHRQAALKQARSRVQACSPERPALSCKVPAGSGGAAPDADSSGRALERLREAAWRAAEDPQTAADAMMAAWVSLVLGP